MASGTTARDVRGDRLSRSPSAAVRALAVLVLGIAGVSALAPYAAAQGGGFVAKEIIVYNPFVQDTTATGGAILRFDPMTGAASQLVDLVTSPLQVGAAAFDPYRQRLLFSAGLGSIMNPVKLWFADGTGAVQDSGLGNVTFHSMAPTGDGRVYVRDTNFATGAFKWIDAAGVLRALLDSAGAAPFVLEGAPDFSVGGMIYDADTNALFVATVIDCPAGAAGRINVRKLPLSADGTRVAGPVGCAQFEVSSSGEVPTGWSRLATGNLLLGVDTNSNDAEPRMLSVNPATLAITAFASNGPYTGAAATNAACWSSKLNKALILDTFLNEPRAYAMGGTGVGAIIPTSIPLSNNVGTGETATMFEIPTSACTGGWIAHGPGLAGKGGFVPSLTGSGCPQPGAAITLKLASVVGGASGALFLGLTPGALPFKGGTLYLASVLTTFNLSVGGTAGVAGAGSLSIPAALPSNPALTGLSLYLQCAWSDATAIQKVSISNSLQIAIG